MDVITLLRKDHRAVEELRKRFEEDEHGPEVRAEPGPDDLGDPGDAMHDAIKTAAPTRRASA